MQPGRVQAMPNLHGVVDVAGVGAGAAGVWLGTGLAVPITEQVEWGMARDVNLRDAPFTKLGLTCPRVQCLSLQSLPLGQNSVLSTTPLSTVATGDGWEYLH